MRPGLLDHRIHRPFLTALGSGVLARLKYLHIDGHAEWGGAGEEATITPGSLPALRILSLCCIGKEGVIEALLGAAGPRLKTLVARTGWASVAVLQAAAERDLAWLTGLQKLRLTLRVPEDEGDGAGVMSQFVSLLPRLPSLKHLSIDTGECVDEVGLRLLVSLESGLLAELTYLCLEGGCFDRRRGFMFLLILWLKRQAMKALESKEPVPGAKLYVGGLYFKPDSCASTLIQQCRTQVKEAQECM